MTTLMIIGLIVAAALLVALGFWLANRKILGRATELAKAATDGFRADHVAALAQWQHWEARAEDAARRAEEFRGLNSSVLLERDKWQRLYWDQVSGHGNAQALMMAEIERLAVRLKGLGQKVEVPPVIRATMDEFTARHVSTVPPEHGTPQIPRQGPEGTQVPDTTSTERVPVKES